MTKSESRRRFSAAVKRLAWKRSNGQCQHCTAPIAGGGFIYDHVIPWELSRDSSLGNCQVLCLTCDDDKTYNRDLPMIAQADRKGDFHIGITGPGHGRCPMPCGRGSQWSKPIGAIRPVRRTTQAQRHRATMALRGVTS